MDVDRFNKEIAYRKANDLKWNISDIVDKCQKNQIPVYKEMLEAHLTNDILDDMISDAIMYYENEDAFIFTAKFGNNIRFSTKDMCIVQVFSLEVLPVCRESDVHVSKIERSDSYDLSSIYNSSELSPEDFLKVVYDTTKEVILYVDACHKYGFVFHPMMITSFAPICAGLLEDRIKDYGARILSTNSSMDAGLFHETGIGFVRIENPTRH